MKQFGPITAVCREFIVHIKSSIRLKRGNAAALINRSYSVASCFKLSEVVHGWWWRLLFFGSGTKAEHSRNGSRLMRSVLGLHATCNVSL